MWTRCNPGRFGGECESFFDVVPHGVVDLCYSSKQSADRWLSLSSECSWAGVACNEGGQVTSLRLPGVGLQGVFPFFINRLKDLEELDLSYGSLRGPIPRSIRRLSKLRVLDLSHNLLVEPIPDPLTWLPLERFNLKFNKFRETLPPSLGNLVRAVHLDLSDNEFMGPLPDELSRAVTLQTLYLGNNKFAGAELPPSWGRLFALRELSLPQNGLEGIIPTDFAGLTQLEIFDLHSNNLTGQLPEMPWPWLRTLHVHDNGLDGPFPPEV